MFPVTKFKKDWFESVGSSLCVGGYLAHPCAKQWALLAQIKEHNKVLIFNGTIA